MTRVVIGMDPHKRSVTIEVMAPDESVLGGGRYGTDEPGYAALLRDGGSGPSGSGRSRAAAASASTSRPAWSPTASRSWTSRRSCPPGPGCSPPARAARPTPPTRTPSRSSALAWPACGRSSTTSSSRCCGCWSTGATRSARTTPGWSPAAPPAARADPGRREEGPVRGAGQGAAGEGPAARPRRQDPPARRRRAHRRPRADLRPQEGRRQGAARAHQRHRHLAADSATASARPAPPGCSSTSATSPGSRPRATSRPGTAPRRSTRPPATRSGTGCPAPATGRSTGRCTSWRPSSCATPARAAHYYDRKKAAGKTSMEAMRASSGGCPTSSTGRWSTTPSRSMTGPGGHPGATTESSAAGSHPDTGTSDKSLPGPATTKPRTALPAAS